MTFRPPPHKRTLIALALVGALGTSRAQSANETELARRLDRLAAELDTVKAELAQLRRQRDAAARADGVPAQSPSAPPATPMATAGVANPAATPSGAADAANPPAATPAPPATVLSSYGEINMNRPTGASRDAQADLRRFVLGIEHRFDARTRMVGELEVEHAVTSADDAGEVALEQAYVEHRFAPAWALRAGLFLMPAGLLNENHEPTAYYGVERNFVETAIIPSTWREGGLQLVGTFDNGLTLQGGISTGFDLTKWDAASDEGRESPLGAIHQELALAKSRDLAGFAALNWRGVPGLLVGGSVFSGLATHGQASVQSRVTLWDLHVRWTPGRWDFSALAARGTISNSASLNAPRVGNPTLIPASFDGQYVQGAYRLWSRGDATVSPFVRWERVNTARSYADLGAGLTPDAARSERIVTLGANWQLTPGVVLKADVQRFHVEPDRNRVDLGLGWSF